MERIHRSGYVINRSARELEAIAERTKDITPKIECELARVLLEQSVGFGTLINIVCAEKPYSAEEVRLVLLTQIGQQKIKSQVNGLLYVA